MSQVLHLFTPNKTISKDTMRLLVLGQLVFLVVVWIFSPFVFLPKPGEILRAFGFLWSQEGLGGELVTSFMLNLQALGLSLVVSLVLAYSSVVPFFQPIVALLSKLRFLSLVGLSFFFTLLASNGHELKLYLLVFSISVFFITGMADVINSVPKEKFDLARTLRFSEWRTVWEVIILGQAAQTFDTFRQNAAMGYMFLTLVEGISRSEGGIGTLLLDSSKHFHLADVLAIDIAILVVGVCQDYTIGLIRQLICPWADLKNERK